MLNIKRLSIIASLLLLIGIVGSIATYKFIAKPESLTEKIEDDHFTDIEISTNDGKIELVPTNEKNTRIEVSGHRLTDNFSAMVTNSTLSISYQEKTKKFYSFGLAQNSASMKIYIPRKSYHSIAVHANNGRLIVQELDADDMILKANNGKISASELKAKKIIVSAKDGSIDLQEIHSDELNVKSNNGRITANSLSGTTIELQAKDGSIDLQQIHSDELNVKSNNGRITANSLRGTTFKLQANDGRIRLTDVAADSISLDSRNGKIELEDVTGALLAQANDGSINLTTDKLDHPIDFSTHNGKIHIQTNHEPIDTEIQAQARNGSIKIFGKKESHAVFGTGENIIDLSSNDGRIIVEKQ
ncbi:DUF4097 family beta strand repeat-containing protein [Sporosarcina oncorhynchi]|uniref:DUF4097 family beta strand repeat-containing protein n=1 Tax=Sporosarcina oncorhynchi TaxID=3056444 RepID=A0ABZ0L3H5_9BACL|nr:DUF4097 family beta strand repeat-containing protein [Sporosarcina sp. T2O-4]WOV86673.1 DUF4097 family beta strand repeat-containing protein [Sporosarcina sp. T2O-4]